MPVFTMLDASCPGDSTGVVAPALALLFSQEMCNHAFLVSVQADETAADPEGVLYFVDTCKANFDICLERG